MTVITVPGSKSLTNRALLLAALSKGESTLHNVLFSDDTTVMIEALHELGVQIEQKNRTLKIMSPGSGNFTPPAKPLYLGNAGTATRFLTAALSIQPFTSQITGDERMQERPIQDLIDALHKLGAHIESPTGCPPLTIHGNPNSTSQTNISGHKSSQYISALLMLGPLLHKGLKLEINDELTSKPYVHLTLDLMNTFCEQGIKWSGYEHFNISPQDYTPQIVTIESDISSATYFWGAAAITGKTITVTHTNRNTQQPDIFILDQIEKMGGQITESPQGITVTGPSELKPLGTLNANAFPDGAMTLAVIAAFAKGKTTLTGLHNLRIKECDRLTALHNELKKIGTETEITNDSITIHGNPQKLHGGHIKTYNDHRIAMCFGMASLVIPDITIENPECTSKTYPTFWNDLKKIT